jgi:hypothetical protein
MRSISSSKRRKHIYTTQVENTMVKTTNSKAAKTVKVAQHKQLATTHSTHDVPEEAASAEASDMDDDEFAECLADHVNDTTFDNYVQKCFIIESIGAIRNVPCLDRNGVQTRKDVYNVNLTNPLGEKIQLTA